MKRLINASPEKIIEAIKDADDLVDVEYLRSDLRDAVKERLETSKYYQIIRNVERMTDGNKEKRGSFLNCVGNP